MSVLSLRTTLAEEMGIAMELPLIGVVDKEVGDIFFGDSKIGNVNGQGFTGSVLLSCISTR
jgi:hypothetical protein